MPSQPQRPARPAGPGLSSLLKPYRHWVAGMAALTVAGNALNLAVPELLAPAIDAYAAPGFSRSTVFGALLLVAIGIFVFAYLQTVAQVFASERIARDLRTKLVATISREDHAFIQVSTPARLLTNLTSDVDAIKLFVSQALPSVVSSVFLIVGAGILLLSIDWRLGLAVRALLPIIGGTFAYVMRKVRRLFLKAQAAIDWLNKVINES